MKTLNISHLKDRIYTEISGGERQMVLIARAITQEPDILVMDEPTANLDFGNQIKVLEQIKRLSKSGLAVFMTTHFPNQAFLCSTKVIILQKNHKFTMGTVEEVITEATLKATYGIDVRITSAKKLNGDEIKACIPLID